MINFAHWGSLPALTGQVQSLLICTIWRKAARLSSELPTQAGHATSMPRLAAEGMEGLLPTCAPAGRSSGYLEWINIPYDNMNMTRSRSHAITLREKDGKKTQRLTSFLKLLKLSPQTRLVTSLSKMLK